MVVCNDWSHVSFGIRSRHLCCYGFILSSTYYLISDRMSSRSVAVKAWSRWKRCSALGGSPGVRGPRPGPGQAVARPLRFYQYAPLAPPPGVHRQYRRRFECARSVLHNVTAFTYTFPLKTIPSKILVCCPSPRTVTFPCTSPLPNPTARFPGKLNLKQPADYVNTRLPSPPCRRLLLFVVIHYQALILSLCSTVWCSEAFKR